MKRIFLVFMLVAVCLCLPKASFGQEGEYDPFKRNLVFVEGEAELIVPVNVFTVTFGFDVQKGSFIDARDESARIIDAISLKTKDLDLSSVEIIKGWDIVKQAKISVGQSGSKLSNRVTIKVKDFPLDKLHKLIAEIIDRSLSINKDIYLEQVGIDLSDDLENSKKEEALTAALKALKSNAERAANTQGLKLVSPKRIYITSDQEVMKEKSYDRKYAMAYDETCLRQSFISVQKGFEVKSQVADHVVISARVSGIYEIQ